MKRYGIQSEVTFSFLVMDLNKICTYQLLDKVSKDTSLFVTQMKNDQLLSERLGFPEYTIASRACLCTNLDSQTTENPAPNLIAKSQKD